MDNDPQHINLMLEFLYDHKYEVVLKPNWFRTRDIVLVHVSLYALGVKYKIPALCHYSAHQIYEHMLSGHLSHYGAQACIPLVYSSTPGTNRALRDLFVSFIVNCTYGMYKSPHTFNVGMEHVHAIKEFREDFVRELLRWCWSEDPEQEGFNFPTYTL